MQLAELIPSYHNFIISWYTHARTHIYIYMYISSFYIRY